MGLRGGGGGASSSRFGGLALRLGRSLTVKGKASVQSYARVSQSNSGDSLVSWPEESEERNNLARRDSCFSTPPPLAVAVLQSALAQEQLTTRLSNTLTSGLGEHTRIQANSFSPRLLLPPTLSMQAADRKSVV